MSIDDFELVKTTAGVLSIRNKVVGEIMHNPIGPWVEANSLYVEQSMLREKLCLDSQSPLVLFDVGLGSASNAIAAIDATLRLGSHLRQRSLHVRSFENNLDLLRFTLMHAIEFEHLVQYVKPLEMLLEKRLWISPCGRVQWTLKEGDFLHQIDAESDLAELVFFDPYSPAVNQDMWTLSCFRKLRKKCHIEASEISTDLYTYSVSTPVRASMLLAGFYVGYGSATGHKKDTTHCSTKMTSLKRPLGQEWFGRWTRSDRKLPYDSKESDEKKFMDEISNHVQFRC
jgi:tRNA U34 5-methylaminomethyl-2-thiouridine-forming methyltransferase MnmC